MYLKSSNFVPVRKSRIPNRVARESASRFRNMRHSLRGRHIRETDLAMQA